MADIVGGISVRLDVMTDNDMTCYKWGLQLSAVQLFDVPLKNK